MPGRKYIPVEVPRMPPRDVRVAEGAAPRRLQHPATSEPRYTADELEFLRAVDDYKRANRRPYPTWREVLAVLVALGYRKVNPAGPPPVFGRGPALRLRP